MYLYDWTVSLHNHNPVDILYIDFSKTFDSVVHSKLIFKLRQIGLPDLLISWLTAFLSDRFQQIRIENVESHISRITSGVPQGSVLGPILFILFINYLDYVLSDIASNYLLTISKYTQPLLFRHLKKSSACSWFTCAFVRKLAVSTKSF